MAKEMKNTYQLTPNGDNTRSPIMESGPISLGHSTKVGTRSSISAALDAAIEREIRMGKLDPNMDKKSMRRIISNRYAAKKSHDKQVNKMTELETNRKKLEDIITTLQPQIEHERQLLSRLRIENEMLARQLQIRIDSNNMKSAQIAEKEKERQWLKGLLSMQVQQQPENEGTDVFDLLEFDPNNFSYVCKPRSY
ncbi:hypothetical protein L2E82_20474 [Cichorium intybus]|uniref:Uncharacterized protein n=1 Tax=Cichorium intybus TaxID=13427 RepID=A0ACB9DTG2_CICIN|nr:hypothetical protein L2E82_20474 [Cichorium intybus]